MFADAWIYLAAHPAQFMKALGVHVSLSLAALTLASAIAIPAGVRLAHSRGGALAAINAAHAQGRCQCLAHGSDIAAWC